MRSLNILITCLALSGGLGFHSKLQNIVKNPLSTIMKKFILTIIEENYREKDGFFHININKIDPEFSDFLIKMLMVNSTTVLADFHKNQKIHPSINPNHFKFAVVDPEGELSHAEASFNKVRISRAKIVLIITKTPISIFVSYILNSYKRIQCTNVIVVYEVDNGLEIMTFNPYLPSIDKTVKLKITDNFFYDKTKNLYGSEIRALLTYPDRTKISQKNNRFEGKDFQVIDTIIQNLNGKLKIIDLNSTKVNPWFESVDLRNRKTLKKSILKTFDIHLLIKSEGFTSNDDVFENLNPHTQNDISTLVPKSLQVPMAYQAQNIYKPHLWAFNALAPILVFLVVITSRKMLAKKTKWVNLWFNIYRIMIVNNFIQISSYSIERFLTIGFLFYGFINNIYLQSKITSLLAIEEDYSEIDTIESLFSSNLVIYTFVKYVNETRKKYVGTDYENIVNSLRPMDTNEGLMDAVMYKIDAKTISALIIEHDIALFMARSRCFYKNGKPNYHLLRESIIPNYQSFKVVSNSPLLPILNKKLRSLQESGFIKLWTNWAIYNATINGFLFPENYKESVVVEKRLSLDDLGVSFEILILGYFISILTCICEIILIKTK